MRQLSAATVAALSAGVLIQRIFAELQFVEQTFGFCNHNADVTINGQVYTGVGTLGSISSISGVTDLSVVGMRLTLSGLDDTVLGDFQNYTWHLRPATVFMGLLDPGTRNLVDTPFAIFKGLIENITVKGGGGSPSAIEVALESQARFLNRVSASVRSDADQRGRLATDTFFVPVANAGQEEIYWGQVRPKPAIGVRQKNFGYGDIGSG